jgi:peptide/nickel transport system permease protein
LLYAFLSFVFITLILYGGIMLVPPEARVQLYIPKGKGGIRAPERIPESVTKALIAEHHLEDSYLLQYGHWLGGLFEGSWGYSAALKEDVLPALLRRTPATLELGLYSLLVFMPFGLWSGLLAGWRPGRPFDLAFRLCAYTGLSMPQFILGLLLLTVFYAKLSWLPPGRLDLLLDLRLEQGSFQHYTGLLTLDGILNSRLDISLNALKHLVLPVFTLSLYHWATLGRITRTLIMEERHKDYLLAARARGIPESRLIWRHGLPSIMGPSLTGIALSAASILTGVYVVEAIFLLNGISRVIVVAMSYQPDAPAILGFAVYSVIVVIALMFVLDVLRVLIDPRVREETLSS